ncbi:inositol 1,4,5-trisphosphate receptor-interacting protein-like 2 [Spea bombifrons]|uniref:inositol 1,4,5-trisphosphate receptor-interacting protein-like 2 n=1 Tax=Spea bombifrons TaxID=233779 RepID=UPI0023495AC7|nr:inositol 1,4,5-trisphosphate receptor-interacting protein-like 2 [Spea bombifrons]
MTVYSVNLKVFWLLVTVLFAGIWCLFVALRRDGSAEDGGGCQGNGLSHLQLLLKLCSVLLLLYVAFRCCGSSLHRQKGSLSLSCQQQPQQLRRNLLETFYEHHIKLSPHVLGHSKAHVSQIVAGLIKVGKAKQQDTGVTFRGDYVQVGSAYEQHKINSPDCFDILVPLKMPQSLKMEPLFASAGKEPVPVLQGSMMCRVAAPKKSEWEKTYKQFSDCFCTESGHSHRLSSALVLKWFHWKIQRCLNVIRYQFEDRCHITLSVCDDKLILKILPRSDYVCCHISMSVRLIPAFHLGDSVFLTAQPWGSIVHPDAVNLDTYWGVNFSKHEQKFMNWFKDQAPANACHLKCLQIMKALRDLNSKTFQGFFSSQWRSVLSSYNLKTALFYLMIKAPIEKWDDSLLMDRMLDYFMFLKECLQNRNLMHFFLGNKNPPNIITLPKMFKEAPPVNLLEGYPLELLDQVCFQLFNMWIQMPRIIRMSSNLKSLVSEPSTCKHAHV